MCNWFLIWGTGNDLGKDFPSLGRGREEKVRYSRSQGGRGPWQRKIRFVVLRRLAPPSTAPTSIRGGKVEGWLPQSRVHSALINPW